MENDIAFMRLAETFAELERTSSRIQMTQILVKALREVPPAVIDKVIYLLQGTLGPEWKSLPELGLGDKYLMKSMSSAFRTSEDTVAKLFKTTGDFGETAERLARQASAKASLFSFGERRRLTASRVYDTLLRIASLAGEGSRDIKIRLLAGLLADAEPLEAKYLVRLVEGRLRVGVGDATILDALSIVYGGSTEAREIVERAYNLRADLGYIARLLAEGGIKSVEKLEPLVGIPLRPMLAERGKDLAEIMGKVGYRAIVEYKYDGERAQIHKDGEKITIFSRRLENITQRYPDVVEMALGGLRAEKAIVEGEIVAYDPDTGELRPFQELMHRKRKHEVERAAKEIPVRVFLFDLLYADGVDYTTKPLPERRSALEKIMMASEDWRMVDYIETAEVKEIEDFFLKAVSDGAEGIMIKAVHRDSVYTAGARGWLWVKYKKDYKSEMVDTVDLVVVGAFYGTGKRGGKLSSLLMAAYDPQDDSFKTVCKMATGFTDEELEKMNEMLKPHIIPRKHHRVDSQMKPDVWIEPIFVAEVLGAEITLSPIHTCAYGKIKEGAGLSIRFPRFVRWREDKRPEDATTVEEIAEMYVKQLRRVEEEGEQT